VGANLVIFIDW